MADISTKNERSLIMGLWKFRDNVGKTTLEELAKEWVNDDAYILLYVRKVSKDQFGIGFARISDGTKEAHSKYFDEVSDKLKRMHGNDLVGWDIATTDSLIKGFDKLMA